MENQDLGVNVQDQVKTKEAFGSLDRKMQGIGGTLHLTSKDKGQQVADLAWQLSEQTNLPVVIVVKAPRSV